MSDGPDEGRFRSPDCALSIFTERVMQAIVYQTFICAECGVFLTRPADGKLHHPEHPHCQFTDKSFAAPVVELNEVEKPTKAGMS